MRLKITAASTLTLVVATGTICSPICALGMKPAAEEQISIPSALCVAHITIQHPGAPGTPGINPTLVMLDGSIPNHSASLAPDAQPVTITGQDVSAWITGMSAAVKVDCPFDIKAAALVVTDYGKTAQLAQGSIPQFSAGTVATKGVTLTGEILLPPNQSTVIAQPIVFYATATGYNGITVASPTVSFIFPSVPPQLTISFPTTYEFQSHRTSQSQSMMPTQFLSLLVAGSNLPSPPNISLTSSSDNAAVSVVPVTSPTLTSGFAIVPIGVKIAPNLSSTQNAVITVTATSGSANSVTSTGVKVSAAPPPPPPPCGAPVITGATEALVPNPLNQSGRAVQITLFSAGQTFDASTQVQLVGTNPDSDNYANAQSGSLFVFHDSNAARKFAQPSDKVLPSPNGNTAVVLDPGASPSQISFTLTQLSLTPTMWDATILLTQDVWALVENRCGVPPGILTPSGYTSQVPGFITPTATRLGVLPNNGTYPTF